jgi:hypothetical protein
MCSRRVGGVRSLSRPVSAGQARAAAAAAVMDLRTRTAAELVEGEASNCLGNEGDSVVTRTFCVSSVADEEAVLVSEEHEHVVRLPLALLPEVSESVCILLDVPTSASINRSAPDGLTHCHST